MGINKRTFSHYIRHLEKFRKAQDELEDAHTKEYNHSFIFCGEYIDLLAKLVDDKHKWIEWYVYENDFGKLELKAYPRKDDLEGMKIKTHEDLYTLIKLTK